MNKQAYIDHFRATGKALVPKFPCTVCGTEITLGADNLTRRVAKYGGIENLVENFKCRCCSKPKEPVFKREKAIKEKKAPKEDSRKQQLIDQSKTFVFTKRTLADMSNPAVVEELTKYGCWRPDIYLNSDRTCDNCHLYNNGCVSPTRRLKGEKKTQKSS